MSYDKQLMKFNQTMIKGFKENSNYERFMYGMDNLGLGFFEWSYNDDIIRINDRLIHTFNLDLHQEISLLEASQYILDKNSQFDFYKAVIDLLEGASYNEIEIPLKLGRETIWYRLKMTHNIEEFYIIGMIEKIHELKVAKYDAEGLSHQLDQILESMPLPIYYYDLDGNVIFTNRQHTEDFSRINKIIEKQIHGEITDLDDYSWIHSLETSQYIKHHMIFRISFRHRNLENTNMIHRVEIMQNNIISGILYLHEDISEFNSDESQLNKVLKANELIIEIKDIVDHVSDLKSMYAYLLSKIHTVIPAAKRACILKIDKEDMLYIAADYGFDKSYVEELSLPFKESFAYTRLRGDYTKSVIIDEIQEKYGTEHPEININQFGFLIRSNITTPLLIDGHLYGILSVDGDENHVFDDVDLNLLDYLKLQIERAIVKFRQLRKVKRNSIIDPLTGIYNRRHIIDLLNQYIEDAHKEEQSFAFVVFDLDKLKKVNDSYGHVAGDQIIKQFAFIAEKEIRDVDVIARIGGDEFVGIFWGINKDILIKRLTRWSEILSLHPIKYEGNTITTNFSYGIAYYPNDGDDFETLLRVSDKKMYEQKNKKE
jgi:diguanylate cyclase (GGDEF)-like protein